MAAVNAVMLAGDRKASKLIMHDNKAFLLFHGEPLFVRVLWSLLAARNVGKIVVVGPRERLLHAIHDSTLAAMLGQRISVSDQGENLLENVKIGFKALLPGDASDASFKELTESKYADTPTLFLPSDIPLVTPYEIDEFIEGSDMLRFDYSVGLTRDVDMQRYYPTREVPGITMEYFHMRGVRCRQNNLHMGKPLRVSRLSYVEKMYELRHQTHFFNMVGIVFELLRTGKKILPSMWYFLRLQLARELYNRQWYGLYERARKGNRLGGIVDCLEQILGVRLQTVFTHFGGAMLDIDNAEHLQIAEQMADEWLSYQKSLAESPIC